jgi:hypothetical protein
MFRSNIIGILQSERSALSSQETSGCEHDNTLTLELKEKKEKQEKGDERLSVGEVLLSSNIWVRYPRLTRQK